MSETKATGVAEPEVGSYFVANYPPFSVWTADAVAREAQAGAGRARRRRACRSACTCTSPSAGSAATSATSASTRTRTRSRSSSTSICWRANGIGCAASAALAGRTIDFVYFGGGTPSFLSTQQLTSLVSRLTAHTPWTSASEITFECEPGHADGSQARRDSAARRHAPQPGRREFRRRHSGCERAGAPLAGNRAARMRTRAPIGFPQINIDLIAGMLGETDENWRRNIERTIELDADSVTIYPMELPYNTTITADILKGSGQFTHHVASWDTRRRWVARSVGGARARRLHDRLRLHGGQGSGEDDVQLSRSAVGRRRSGGARRRVVRPRQRRPHAERGHVGNLRRGDRTRRAAARPRAPTDGGRTADSRDDSSTQARQRPPELLRGQVRRRYRAIASPTSGARSPQDGYLAPRSRRPHRAHARGPAAR